MPFRTVGTETCWEVVGTNVGLVSKANDDKNGLKSARELIEEMSGTGVNVLTKEGRACLSDDGTELV